MNAWDNLPNAKHIDRVLAFIKKNPYMWDATKNAAWLAAKDEAWYAALLSAKDEAWYAAWLAAKDEAWYAAKDAVWNAAKDAVWNAARDAAWDAAKDEAWYAARDAVLALIAYDDCVYLLDMKADQVKILALLGQPAAVLLYPACLAFEMEMASEYLISS